MPNPNALQTTAVTVTFTLNSADGAPPYNVDTCSLQITYNDNSNITQSGWGSEGLGTPQPNGATFALIIADTAAPPLSGIGNWALTCIPRAGTATASPFGNNTSTLTGNGATVVAGGRQLNLGTVKIKNAGTWDWALMVQVICSDGQTVKCFGSDPEMEVGA